MQNSNELFKTFILNQLALAKRDLITEIQAHEGIRGYYKALENMNGVDMVTTLYKDLAGYVLAGTPNQQKNAQDLLNGTLDILTVLDVLRT